MSSTILVIDDDPNIREALGIHLRNAGYNVQTPEERSKQVFRVKVTLDEGLDVLRPGMSADVLLDAKE